MFLEDADFDEGTDNRRPSTQSKYAMNAGEDIENKNTIEKK